MFQRETAQQTDEQFFPVAQQKISRALSRVYRIIEDECFENLLLLESNTEAHQLMVIGY